MLHYDYVQDLGVQEVEMRDLNLERQLLLVVLA